MVEQEGALRLTLSRPGKPTGHRILLLVGATDTSRSDTSDHLFSRLYAAGVPTARLDLDEVGMCHPAPDDDPDDMLVKAEAMAAAWSVFRSHGARCLVVSGGMSNREHVDLLVDIDGPTSGGRRGH